MLAFEVKGGREAAWQFINGTELMSLTANLGDAKTPSCIGSTTHGRLTAEQRDAWVYRGVGSDCRGSEDLEDLKLDCLEVGAGS